MDEMGPVSALEMSFRKSFDFSGRASRSEFWWTWGLLYSAAMLIMHWRGLPTSGPNADILATVITIALALPMIAVGTRRLVDAGVWRWLFVLVFLFGVIAQFLYRIPVPAEGELQNLSVQFDDKTVPASELGHYPFLRVLFDIMPWVGRPLAILCLLLALLPTRRPTPNPNLSEVLQ
ncbi:MAG: DUF805 domain-containing protein [Tateyamaria sp.]|uniref:DUF805 domain-containing protein n=1 Tax=Tateyamaria sp. TaxID=1929288 RepID=UPI0032780C4D